MVRNEIKKSIQGMMLIIVVFLIGFICMLFNIKSNYKASDVQYYKLYIDRLEGPLTPEKKAYIEEEYEKVIDIIDKQNAMMMNGHSSIDFELLDYAFNHEQAFKMVYERYEYICDMEDKSEQIFYYDLDWKNFFEKTNTNYFEIFLLIAISLYAITMEFSSKRDVMLKTTYRGKLSYIMAKQGAVMLLMLLTRVLFFVAELTYMGLKLGVDSLSYPLRSMKMFSMLEIKLTIGQYLIISELYHMLWCVVISLIMLLIGQLTRKLQSGLLIGLVTVVLPVTLKGYLGKKYWVWVYGINMVKNDSVCRLWTTGVVEALVLLIVLLVVNSYIWSKPRKSYS